MDSIPQKVLDEECHYCKNKLWKPLPYEEGKPPRYKCMTPTCHGSIKM